MGHQPHEEVGVRQEVGVEDGDELAPSDLQPGLESARLVTGTVGPVEVLDVHAESGTAPHGELRDAAGFVRRVVEHLDFEKLSWIIKPAHRVDQAVGYVHFVVQRQLNGHHRKG